MVTLWVGDFRTSQLQTLYKAAQYAAEYQYLVDNSAEYSWFKGSAVAQLEDIALENANVVIMLGLNDCIYSCVWEAFKIDKIAKQYAAEINKLVSEYPNFNFYVCSVNPIDGDYPFSEYTNGVIPRSILTKKIELFNETLNAACKAIFIDSYNYLLDTSFATRDGTRFTVDTCNIIHSYISAQLKSTIAASFMPRISAPDPEVDSYVYWLPKTDGGENPFTLPSCTAYAWGRFYEITGEAPTLCTGTAEYWYQFIDGYKRGDIAKLGAIMCWQQGSLGDLEGHVAIVEQVKEDGSIITSESTSSAGWQLIERTKGTDNNWGMPTSYTFQGFIYSPQTISASKEELCTKNSYSISIDEMKPNARYIWQYFSSRGWTLNAVAGLLGNIQQESKMSPAIWESTIEGSIINADGTQVLNMSAIDSYYAKKGCYPGYGLTQWTPYSKYTDWCASHSLAYWDMDSQLQRIEYEVENKIQWQARPSKGYNLTFSEFIASTQDAAWLAEAFAFCYERPARSSGTTAEQDDLRKERGANGDFWYSYLSTLPIDTASSAKLKINNFRIDSYSSTQVSASFLLSNDADVKCSILKNESLVDSLLFSAKNVYKKFTFKDLTPNTEYVLRLEVATGDVESITRELSFITKQDIPNDVKNIKLTAISANNLNINSLFALNVMKPDYLGYWKSHSGYDICLIVDNKIVKTLNIDDAEQDIYWKSFNITNKFNYKCALGDNIQIGVRTWVKALNNEKLYSNNLLCSEPICLLNKSVSLYLVNK